MHEGKKLYMKEKKTSKEQEYKNLISFTDEK